MLPIAIVNLTRCGGCGVFFHNGVELSLEDCKTADSLKLDNIPLICCDYCRQQEEQEYELRRRQEQEWQEEQQRMREEL